MAGSYRPRPTELKVCTHCGANYESRHKRTLYCGSSCRTLAYNLRHADDLAQSSKAKGDLSFSLQNVAVTGVGSAIAAVGNYAFNDLPAHREIMNELTDMKEGLEIGLNQILQLSQHQIDFINAMKAVQPGLANNIVISVENRKANQLKAEQAEKRKKDIVEILLARKRGQ